MAKKLLFLLALLLVSCKEEAPSKAQPFTANEQQLIDWYNRAMAQRNIDHFKIIKYADSISRNNKNETPDFKALEHISYGTYYNSINNDSLSFQHFNAAVNLAKKTKNDTLLTSSYSGLGNYYKHLGDYPKATKHYLLALNLSEKRNDTMDIANMHANIGQLDLQKDDPKQALYHLSLAKKMLDNHKERPAYLIAIHTLANLKGMGGNFAEALKLDEEGIKLAKKINSNDLRATFLDNKANCFMFSGQLDSARYYFNECLKLDLMGKNEKQISDSYANLAHLAVFSNNLSEVIDYTKKSISIAEKVNYNPGIAKNYFLLIDYYKSKGDYKNAYEYSDKYHKAYKDAINDRKEVAQAEFKTIYETEKKEKELLISKANISEKEMQIKKATTQFQVLILISLALASIGYLIYRQQKLKNAQQEQEYQLKSAIKEIESKNQLHEQRLSISRDLHDNIGAQLTFVISSVDNLKFGNQAVDPKITNQLTKISDFTQSTIIELRDTIWAMNTNEFTFDDLRSRIFNFIEKAKIAKEGVDFVFAIDDSLSDIKLSSIVGINIYRTIQEAINNAIKYSDAQKIEVNASKENGKIKITVADNGKGFDAQTVEYGNGLHNMKKRIEEIGGQFAVESVQNQGTTILVLIK